jgi:hypothetical protein
VTQHAAKRSKDKRGKRLPDLYVYQPPVKEMYEFFLPLSSYEAGKARQKAMQGLSA